MVHLLCGEGYGELQFNYYIYALTVYNGTFAFSPVSKYMKEKVK